MIELLSADWNYWPDGLTRSEIVETTARLGVAGLELGIYDTNVELNPERLQEWNELGSSHGVRVRALLYSMPPDRWPNGGLAASSSRTRFLEQMEELLEVAVNLGLDVVGLWPGADSVHADRRDFGRLLSELSVMASQRNVGIAVEPKPATLVAGPDDVDALRRTVAKPESVGLLLDTGHEFAAGRDPRAIVETIEAPLLHLHLGDSDGDPDADLPPGRVHRLDEFLTVIVGSDYRGAMSPDVYGAVEAGVVTGAAALAETIRCVSEFFEGGFS